MINKEGAKVDIDMRMINVIREIRSGSSIDPDWNLMESVKAAIMKFDLNQEEIRYVGRHFGLLTEDI
jgi:hypothetical protein